MKNRILKSVTVIALIILILGITTIDTEGTIIPSIMILAPMVWLLPFCLINKDYKIR